MRPPAACSASTSSTGASTTTSSTRRPSTESMLGVRDSCAPTASATWCWPTRSGPASPTTRRCTRTCRASSATTIGRGSDPAERRDPHLRRASPRTRVHARASRRAVVKPVGESGGYGILIAAAREPQGAGGVPRKLRADPGNYIKPAGVQLSRRVPDRDARRHRAEARGPAPFASRARRPARPGCCRGLTRVALRKGSLIVNSSQAADRRTRGSLNNLLRTSRPNASSGSPQVERANSTARILDVTRPSAATPAASTTGSRCCALLRRRAELPRHRPQAHRRRGDPLLHPGRPQPELGAEQRAHGARERARAAAADFDRDVVQLNGFHNRLGRLRRADLPGREPQPSVAATIKESCQTHSASRPRRSTGTSPGTSTRLDGPWSAPTRPRAS